MRFSQYLSREAIVDISPFMITALIQCHNTIVLSLRYNYLACHCNDDSAKIYCLIIDGIYACLTHFSRQLLRY